MLRFLVVFFISSLFLTNPHPVNAIYTETHNGITYTVEQDPQELVVGQNSSVTLTVKSSGAFDARESYNWNVISLDGGGCLARPRQASDYKTNSADAFTVTVDFTKCYAAGRWRFKLWIGGMQQPAPTTKTAIIDNYLFQVRPVDYTTPKMYAENNPLNYLDKPRVRITDLKAGQRYTLWWDKDNTAAASTGAVNDSIWYQWTDGPVTKELDPPIKTAAEANVKKYLRLAYGDHFVIGGIPHIAEVEFYITNTTVKPPEPSCNVKPSEKPTVHDDVSLEAVSLEKNQNFSAVLANNDGTVGKTVGLNSNGKDNNYFEFKRLPLGKYTVTVLKNYGDFGEVCKKNFEVIEDKGPGDPNTGGGTGNSRTGAWNCGPGTGRSCTSAAGDMCSANSIRTAIGCVPTEPASLIKGLIKVVAAAGGGIALLLMGFGAIQMMISQGTPEGIKAGQERLTSAALGLLFILFSVVLLRIIGVDILKLPGFIP